MLTTIRQHQHSTFDDAEIIDASSSSLIQHMEEAPWQRRTRVAGKHSSHSGDDHKPDRHVEMVVLLRGHSGLRTIEHAAGAGKGAGEDEREGKS